MNSSISPAARMCAIDAVDGSPDRARKAERFQELTVSQNG
jgi:hypothetical protein